MQFQQMEISTMPQVEEIQMLDSKENRNQTRRILQLHCQNQGRELEYAFIQAATRVTKEQSLTTSIVMVKLLGGNVI